MTDGLASVGGVATVDDTAPGGSMPMLEFPSEPEELRIGLRDALLAGGDWREGFSDEICIGVWLWSRWQPVLEPGGSFEYTSGVPLQTPSGFMEGSYGMVTQAGEPFDIEIPAFSLDSPMTERTIN